MRPPDYGGGGLVNLVAELERRLGGTPPSPPLAPGNAALVPEAESYLVLLFDGLGESQLAHPAAEALRDSSRGVLDAPFPTTTTVSMATLATGLPPSQHGLLGYQLWLPPLERVVNTLQWTTLWGEPVEHPFEEVLPSPNLWERLSAAGREPVTVQPGHFQGSPLSRVLYRGVRFEPAFSVSELVEASLALSAVPGRLVFAYLPHVDVAAHTHGQGSSAYDEAIATAATLWAHLSAGLPAGVSLIGTADHGLVDVPPERQVEIPSRYEKELTFYGDPRVTFVRGPVETAAELAGELPATWLPLADVIDWWGPEPRHPEFEERAPDGVLVADGGYMLLHRFSDRRLVGAHGALTEEEMTVPLLVAE